ncbi:MAG: phosphonate ABC transporter, permease protein PhnE [Dehalococcoidia bacterium]|nr:phosphonate ABC transporter, permease protein PhnE [Dehalococcoidia bacterium]
MNRRVLRGRLFILALGVALIYSLAGVGLLDAQKLARGLGNIALFSSDLFPPDAGVITTVAPAMVETLQIALVGTFIGTVVAMPLALLAMPILTNSAVAPGVRLVLAFIRTIPALLWGVLFVVAFGLGPAAGATGIGLYSAGYLGKLFYELLEGVDPEVVEAVRSVGCSRLQLARYALLPEAANGLLAQLLFMFEYNVRASSIMGFVGAGGIGYYMLGYIQLLRYDALLTAVLITLLVVIVIDWLSIRIRGAFLLHDA